MKAEDVLKTASDTIIVSADEPLAQSVDRYIEAMRRQYGFTEEEVRAAVDIAVLSRRQEQLIDARIKAFNLYSAAGQLAYFWMVCRPLIISAAAIVLAVIGALILKALAKILERS